MKSPAFVTSGDVEAGEIMMVFPSSTIGAAASVDELAYTPTIA